MKIFLPICLMMAASLTFGKTFELRDGTIMIGDVVEETESTITIKTKYTSVTIDKTDLVEKKYKVTLLSGETFSGMMESEGPDSVTLSTPYGTMTFLRKDLKEYNEVGSEVKVSTESVEERRTRVGLTGSWSIEKGLGLIADKDKDFSTGVVQLTDLFFYPIGKTLNRGDFYLSGLSFGFGVSDRLMVTSKFTRFFVGDMNVRVKYKLFGTGNIDKGTSFSVGIHPHTRWESSSDSGPLNRNYEWRSGSIPITEYHFEQVDFDQVYYGFRTTTTNYYDDTGVIESQVTQVDSLFESNSFMCQVAVPSAGEMYYGGYYGLTDEVVIDNDNWDDQDSPYTGGSDYDENAIFDDENINTDERIYGPPDGCYRWAEVSDNNVRAKSTPTTMVELFTAFTRYNSLPGKRGQIAHTLGASALIISPGQESQRIIPKAYYGFDMDITPKLKSIFIASYDPTYIEPFQWFDINDERYDYSGDGCGDWELCDEPIEQYANPSPFHFDIGFMYAMTPTFRIGIHFQNPWIGFYWKF